MHIAILSRNRTLHSIRRLLQEARRLGVTCDVLNPLECQLVVDGKQSCILYGPNPLPKYDAVLPRIGASITDYGIAVVKQFEALNTYVVNGSRAIDESRDKLTSLQVLAHAGLRVPTTVLSRSNRGMKAAIQAVHGMPVVLKTLRGTQGVGVMLINTPVSLSSVMDTLHSLDQDALIQRFLAEGAGKDYRAFVIGDRVVAAMMRTAAEGEFRSNIHRGGEGQLIKLPRAFTSAAIRAARTLGVEVAGVDLMASKDGPQIIEVNSSPGFEGIERATGLNIAAMIMQHIVAKARARKRSEARRIRARKAKR